MPPSTQALWFGPANEPLFGWYHGPFGPAPRGMAVVVCPPFGYEAICTHRALRALAVRLAAAGLPVLRFDYHGTGDSSGDDRAAGRMGAWLESVGLACDEVRTRSGAKRVALVGLRLGGTLAFLAAAERAAKGDVAALVLWAPLLSGRTYLRELKMLRSSVEGEMTVPSPPPPLGRGERDEEAGGFLLTASTLESLRGINLLAAHRAPAPAAFIGHRDDMAVEPALADHLASLGMRVSDGVLPGYAALMQDPHKAEIPEEAFTRVCDWLGDEAALAPGLEVPGSSGGTEVATLASAGMTIREEAISIDVGGLRLSGIVTEPALPTPGGARRGIVMFNAGAVRRVGPNRLHVSLARAWAARGFTCLRIDLGCIGDSDGDEAPRTRLYSMAAVPEARAVIDYLRVRLGTARVTVMGLCSGAYVSFHAAMANPGVDRSLLINPQTFYWRESDGLDMVRRRALRAAQHYRRSVFRPESWAKLVRGEVDVTRAVSVLAARGIDQLKDRVRWMRAALGLEPEDEVLSALGRTVAGGVQTVLLMCRDDPGMDYLESHLGKGLARLPDTAAIKVHLFDGPDHTFTPLWAQQMLVEALSGYVSLP
jgi:pimeloyl-ACP methyl ester carboxylesterase